MQNQNIITNEKPEIFPELEKKFNVSWDEVIVTSYPQIHTKKPFSDAKYVHELVHLKQQGDMGVDIWWRKYLSDDAFRLEQELEAYRTELAFIKENVKDRNEQYRLKNHIYKTLSSSVYGGIVTLEEARQLLM